MAFKELVVCSWCGTDRRWRREARRCLRGKFCSEVSDGEAKWEDLLSPPERKRRKEAYKKILAGRQATKPVL